jgi:5-methylcytosine-specific restriction endonuclease McrA
MADQALGRFSTDPARALDLNPYQYIKCYHCNGLTIKSSFDIYFCPNCYRTLLAAYPRDWKDRKLQVFQRDRYRCTECGRSVLYQEKHCDHILPVALGGTHDSRNLRTLCMACHLAKHPDRQVYYLLNRSRYSAPTQRTAAHPQQRPPQRKPYLPWKALLLLFILSVLLYYLTL